jgi:GntR family transcriptional regulator/MocR family aminotransferase
LRFDGHPLAALRALDAASRVIYVGTFSKVLFPSLRLGYMVVPPALRDDFLAAKWLSDMASPAIEQAALAALIADGSFERFLRTGIKDLKLRRDTLLDGLRTHVGDRLELYDPPAGMHIVGWFRNLDEAHAARLIDHAASRGLGLHPMAPFYLDPPSRPGILIGYAGMSCADIREATRLFGSCLRELGL